MQKYFESVVSSNGSAVQGASISVYSYGLSTLATIYSDSTGTTTKTNPITTDNNGYFEFYAADGRYSITVSGAGIGTRTITDIQLDDPNSASPLVASTLIVNGTDYTNLYPNMITQVSTAQGYSTSAATSATQAAAARDAAIAAWAASMNPAETLPAISKSLHYGAVVKSIIYDTSKDSDGGAWRKRCTDKSWYTETLGFTGTWGGQAASNALGWAACGSVTGGAYQSTADGKFYTPTSVSTQTEIFRGNVREFPEQVAIVAETGRVVIYDLTQVGTPMWMVFTAAANFYVIGIISSLAAVNGKLIVGTGSQISVIDFIGDSCALVNSSFRYIASKNVSNRNSASTFVSNGSGAIVNSTVNDVAITVLDTAPIDPATGLPVPVIAVATAGGVSVIKDDGTVSNYAVSVWSQIAWMNSSTLAGRKGSASNSNFQTFELLSYPALINTQITTPTHLAGNLTTDMANRSAANSLVVFNAGDKGASLLKHNPATPTKGMVSYITQAYNTGWMPGDIRGAYLADTTAETITASGELVTNGTFTTDTSGWTVVNSGILSAAGALLTVTNDATGVNAGIASQAITTVVGKTYFVTADFTKGTAATGAIFIGTTQANSNLASQNLTASGKFSVMFVATGTTTYIAALNNTLVANATSQFDNISVKLADPDRSVKNTGLVLNGTLTKAVVASGSGLVSYSGFSASNYLEQPYNANLDFGTGDFCVMGWVNHANSGTPSSQVIVDRGTVGGAHIGLLLVAQVLYYVCHTTYAPVSTSYIAPNGLSYYALVRASGVLYVYVNGVQIYTLANTNNVTNTTASLDFGVQYDHTVPINSSSTIALWRISATAPSADQIAHIYRTELPLFQAGAQCTIAGTSTAVTALGYDENADTLHVGTSWGRSSFRDLLRVDSEATSVGAVTSISGNQGAILTGGATTGKFYQPAFTLRDELRRKDEARKALGRVVVPLSFTATAAQTTFVCTKGYDVRFVYANGLLKTLTTDYTITDDGFQKSVVFGSGLVLNTPVTILLTRA